MTSPAVINRLLSVAFFACVLLAAGCGGDDDPVLETDTTGEIQGGDGSTTGAADGATTDGASEDSASEDSASEDSASEDSATGGGGSDGEDTATATGSAEDTGGDSATGETGADATGDVAFPTPAPISGTPAFTEESKLTTVGLDEVFFGDTVADAARKVGTEWIGLPERGNRPACFTVQPEGGPAGTVFMVLDGRIERIDIASPIITTRSGIGVGSTEAEIVELFADSIETTETAAGNEIAFVPTDEVDRDFRIIWTTDGTTVTAMRAGRLPGVLTASPCA